MSVQKYLSNWLFQHSQKTGKFVNLNFAKKLSSTKIKNIFLWKHK
jgi:hypothetical protein